MCPLCVLGHLVCSFISAIFSNDVVIYLFFLICLVLSSLTHHLIKYSPMLIKHSHFALFSLLPLSLYTINRTLVTWCTPERSISPEYETTAGKNSPMQQLSMLSTIHLKIAWVFIFLFFSLHLLSPLVMLPLIATELFTFIRETFPLFLFLSLITVIYSIYSHSSINNYTNSLPFSVINICILFLTFFSFLSHTLVSDCVSLSLATIYLLINLFHADVIFFFLSSCAAINCIRLPFCHSYARHKKIYIHSH